MQAPVALLFVRLEEQLVAEAEHQPAEVTWSLFLN